jgi:hypothetical protein
MSQKKVPPSEDERKAARARIERCEGGSAILLAMQARCASGAYPARGYASQPLVYEAFSRLGAIIATLHEMREELAAYDNDASDTIDPIDDDSHHDRAAEIIAWADRFHWKLFADDPDWNALRDVPHKDRASALAAMFAKIVTRAASGNLSTSEAARSVFARVSNIDLQFAVRLKPSRVEAAIDACRAGRNKWEKIAEAGRDAMLMPSAASLARYHRMWSEWISSQRAQGWTPDPSNPGDSDPDP